MSTSLRAGWLGLVFVTGLVASAGAQEHPAAGLPVPRSSLTDSEQARAIQAADPQGAVAEPSQLHPTSARAPGAR